MLRNISRFTQSQRNFTSDSVACAKLMNVGRQGKIMSKLFGNRETGSKKRWYPTQENNSSSEQSCALKISNFGKPFGGGKNATRRMTVLNKLFMKHITDQLATGVTTEAILGRGLQVTRVKISPDFAYVNVYWLGNGDPTGEVDLEKELKRCSGLMRHELSQLSLMSVVPRIRFVREKLHANMNQVEALLCDMDFGDNVSNEENESHIRFSHADKMKDEFYGKTTPTFEVIAAANVNQPPEMRHDVLGLDHHDIMTKILTKMRKSKQAWDVHNQTINIHETPAERLEIVNTKLAEIADTTEKFNRFLANRRYSKDTPERKKYNRADQMLHLYTGTDPEIAQVETMSSQQSLYDAEDYINDEQCEIERKV